MIKSYLFLLAALAFSFCFISKIESFDPNAIPYATRDSWCKNNIANCQTFCRDNGTTGATTNTCDATTFTYSCVCSDGRSPDSNYYTMPVDYFKCTSDQDNCTQKCGPANQDCVNKCAGNCSATMKKTYTYALPSSTLGSTQTSATSSTKSSPSSLLTPSLANKSTPAITIGLLIVFLTSITTSKMHVAALRRSKPTDK
ncbi:26147_t:CDS:2, partial [Racocetra persica]